MNKEIEVMEKYLNGLISYPFQHKDKEYILSYIKQLQIELEEAQESITWWTNRFSTVMREKKDLINQIKNLKQQNKITNELKEQLENNRDKAIEEIDKLLVYNEFSDTTKGFGNVAEQLKFYLSDYDNLEDFRKLLKGDSDEKRNV